MREEKTFAKGMNYYKLFWIFMIGCVGGVIIETFWCLLKKGVIESRSGLIYGPFNPVYGFGALLMAVCLNPLQKRSRLWIFLGSALIGGGFEYLCSLFQELAFGTVSWEYSHSFANLHGRTNLAFSVAWGILGLIWVKNIFPTLNRWIEKIPRAVGVLLTWLFTVFMIFNMAISALAVYRQSQRRMDIPAQNQLDVFLDRHYPDDYLKKIYPNMQLAPEREK